MQSVALTAWCVPAAAAMGVETEAPSGSGLPPRPTANDVETASSPLVPVPPSPRRWALWSRSSRRALSDGAGSLQRTPESAALGRSSVIDKVKTGTWTTDADLHEQGAHQRSKARTRFDALRTLHPLCWTPAAHRVSAQEAVSHRLRQPSHTHTQADSGRRSSRAVAALRFLH